MEHPPLPIQLEVYEWAFSSATEGTSVVGSANSWAWWNSMTEGSLEMSLCFILLDITTPATVATMAQPTRVLSRELRLMLSFAPAAIGSIAKITNIVTGSNFSSFLYQGPEKIRRGSRW